MKTAVIGLFDDVDDARRVLAQLVGSPLDLSTIQVVNADAETERTLATEAGLPGKHHVLTGIIAGAVLGAALGVLGAQHLDLMARLGSLLSGAAGILLGGAIGGLIGAAAGRLRLPEDQDELVMSAIDEGATAIVVRTENVPTARAIRDLFQAGGSRVAQNEPETDTADSSSSFQPPPDDGADPMVAPVTPQPDTPDDDHSRFAPPWRRRSKND